MFMYECDEGDYSMPESRKEFCKMVSLTAAKTTRIYRKLGTRKMDSQRRV